MTMHQGQTAVGTTALMRATSQAPQATPQAGNALAELNGQLEQLNQDYAMIVDRMLRVLNRAFGERVADPKSPSPAAVPQGMMGTLGVRVEEFRALNLMAHGMVDNLDNLA